MIPVPPTRYVDGKRKKSLMVSITDCALCAILLCPWTSMYLSFSICKLGSCAFITSSVLLWHLQIGTLPGSAYQHPHLLFIFISQIYICHSFICLTRATFALIVSTAQWKEETLLPRLHRELQDKTS